MMRLLASGISDETELKEVCSCGADAAGFNVGQRYAGKNFILPSTAGRLAANIPPFVTPVLMTQESDPDEILSLVGRTGIMTVEIEFFDPDKLGFLRDRLPKDSRIVQKLFAADGAAMADYEACYATCSCLVLDVSCPGPGLEPGAGVVELDRARAMISRSLLPVLLTGNFGLDELGGLIGNLPPFYGIEIAGWAGENVLRLSGMAREVNDR